MDYEEYERAVTDVDWMAMFASERDREAFGNALKAGGDAIRAIEQLRRACEAIQVQECAEK